jgi:hypothetical protein
MRLLGCSALALVCLFTQACGSKGAVSLVATVGLPQLEVETLTLGAQLRGGFDLLLDVGPEAESGTDVSIETFALSRGGMTLVSPLQVTPVDATLPIAVGKGQHRQVHFAIDESKLIEAEERDQLCAGPVRVTGAIRDTLSGGSLTQLVSPEATPVCR